MRKVAIGCLFGLFASIFPHQATASEMFQPEYSLNSFNAPPAGSNNMRVIITSETNAWSPSSAINTYRTVKPFNAFLAPCSEVKIQVCISSIETRLNGQDWKIAQVLSDMGHPNIEIPTGDDSGNLVSYKLSTFDGDLLKSLPPGGNPRLWESTDPALNGALIKVVADVHGFQAPNSSGLALQVKLVTNNQQPNTCLAAGGKWNTYVEGNPSGGFCDLTLRIPENLEFKVKLKFIGFEDPIKGWFTSTILSPRITFDKGELSIEGGATSHSNFVSEPIPGAQVCEIYSTLNQPTPCTFTQNNYPNGVQNILSREWASAAMPYAKYFQQKSLGEQNLWLFESTFQTPFNTTFHNSLGNCQLKKPIFGVISTDAALYSISDLKWNTGNKSFDYSVYSTHLNSSGAVNKGFFSLQVDRSVANCLWNTELTSAKAELSITYEDGSSDMVAATIGKDDEWVSFEASGFHYSAPHFNASIKTNSQSQSTVQPSVRINITCSNGKLFKKVSGSNPKCPKGYKIKK
jgi:hypothetical protein